MRLGTGELLIILAVVLLIFGANKIPQFGDALGRGIRNFKRASRASGADEESGAGAPAALQAKAVAAAVSHAAPQPEVVRAQRA